MGNRRWASIRNRDWAFPLQAANGLGSILLSKLVATLSCRPDIFSTLHLITIAAMPIRPGRIERNGNIGGSEGICGCGEIFHEGRFLCSKVATVRRGRVRWVSWPTVRH